MAELSGPSRNSNTAAHSTGGRLSNFLHEEGDAVAQTLSSIRRSSIIRKLRLILPVIAVAIVAVMFLWSDMDEPPAPKKREEVAPQSVGRNELINPKFVSEDQSQQPYTITAKRAVQNAQNMEMIELEKPVADVGLKNGAALSLHADSGQYEQAKQVLDLNGNVTLLHDEGYEIKTNRVAVDINKQTAVSTDDVSGEGPAGFIESKGLTANGATGVLSFTGPAKLTIKQKTTAPQASALAPASDPQKATP